jgi:hypothetical protein
LTRQQRPHPSQRLSHSAVVSDSSGFRFQNGASSASVAEPRGFAAKSAPPDAASLLREKGGGINLRVRGQSGQPPLRFAMAIVKTEGQSIFRSD